MILGQYRIPLPMALVTRRLLDELGCLRLTVCWDGSTIGVASLPAQGGLGGGTVSLQAGVYGGGYPHSNQNKNIENNGEQELGAPSRESVGESSVQLA